MQVGRGGGLLVTDCVETDDVTLLILGLEPIVPRHDRLVGIEVAEGLQFGLLDCLGCSVTGVENL